MSINAKKLQKCSAIGDRLSPVQATNDKFYLTQIIAPVIACIIACIIACGLFGTGNDGLPPFKKTRRFTPYKKTVLRENTTTIVFLSREALAFE